MKTSREKKSNWYFDKFLKVKFENKQLFHYKIKKNVKNNNGYELLKKDFQMSNLLKNKHLLIKDIKEKLNQLLINKDITKELKEENDTFLNQVSNIKEFNKHYLKSDDKNFETHKFKDLIMKYNQKGLNIIPKLIKNYNIFKKEPILSGNNKQNMFESLIFNPKSAKNIFFLQKIKYILNDKLIEGKKNENEVISKNENQSLNNSNYKIKNISFQNKKLIKNYSFNYNESKSISNISFKGNEIINKKKFF